MEQHPPAAVAAAGNPVFMLRSSKTGMCVYPVVAPRIPELAEKTGVIAARASSCNDVSGNIENARLNPKWDAPETTDKTSTEPRCQTEIRVRAAAAPYAAAVRMIDADSWRMTR